MGDSGQNEEVCAHGPAADQGASRPGSGPGKWGPMGAENGAPRVNMGRNSSGGWFAAFARLK